ncbi:Uncharacterized protein MSYG_4197 [Malassezia sympodialis ATCC 42132]|uniref:Calcineurin-like phosphoesterase domain-containing protein n=1 Tax=Malassezia sympodialis (strain ATCC 42132) TaxID=1230383 RepID=A0A1M8ABJ5_MALS4|nr:Uncharacterized protein MSYG_4197 [Malassezia sympodialis ATCC 42132]
MRWWGLWAALLVAGFLYSAWPRTYAYRRVVAIGDLHGDYDQALEILRATHVVDERSHWDGGDTVLVSTGDTVDRGDATIKLYEMFQRLRTESGKAGGQVVTLLGNHEVMNALGDWRYVTPGDLASFGGHDARRHAMSTDGWLGREWLTHYAVTASVPLLDTQAESLAPALSRTHRASFVHGGISPVWAQLGTDSINAHAHGLLRKALTSRPSNGMLPGDALREERALWAADGPLWYRGYALDAERDACANADHARRTLDVQSLIMGHTPQMGGIARRCADDRLYIIDTGMSHAYGGRASALEIASYLRRGWFGTMCVHSTYTAVYAREGAQRLSHTVHC